MGLSIAVAGPLDYGTFNLRGLPIHEKLDTDLLNIRHPPAKNYDVIILVKRVLDSGFSPSPEYRKKAGKLIFDPLDYWNSKEKTLASRFWGRTFKQIQPDIVLATSPACLKAMSNNTTNTRIELVPHQADPRIDDNWYDPSGPIVYIGDPRFIEKRRPIIREACDMMRIPFKHSKDINDLKGARLVLALRLSPWQTDLNIKCKPQIKVENALAGGIPVLTTGHRAETSLHPSLVTMQNPDTRCPKRYVAAMTEAIARGTHLESCFTEEQYIEKIKELVYE